MTIPVYTKSIEIPRSERAVIFFRYYAPWGDGSPEGWKIPVPPPQVSVNGVTQQVKLLFSLNSGDENPPEPWAYEKYINGQTQGGFDQHAQYYSVIIEPDVTQNRNAIVTGIFQVAGYYSVVAYMNVSEDLFRYSYTIPFLDKELDVSDPQGNPYIEGNNSVFYYNNQKTTGVLAPSHNDTKIITGNTKRAGEVYFYRPTMSTSVSNWGEDVASDGCSRDYLYTKQAQNHEVLILRIKLPITFVRNDSPDVVFGEYECRELSVNCNISSLDSVQPLLDYWSVSSRMLNEFKDSNGYAYVFFAPTHYTQQKHSEQAALPQHPPVITWGNYTGYLLGEPTHSVIIRYRDPDSKWQGNPGNSQCYSEAFHSPVTAAELAEYLPELFGGTLAEFEGGNIGEVNQNRPWPTVE
ncbi:hypothetical protein OVA10_23535 [Lelliottia sp. SL45]|uniref:hypothetical protein n=1 Tax=Lelliottia sp. SL45 TaxID=2994665 RepID=UPI002272F3EE|nr:hypothetical protein [Lelliottia sp. SL45]MCY1700985.1 hypothetical protein [Lelliottia sp. SL45]